MNLLNTDGNIIDNAASVIDSYFNFDEGFSTIPIATDFPCESTVLQRRIQESIRDIDRANSIDLTAFYGDSNANQFYQNRIYGEPSRKISKLDPDFIPFAECIIAFIHQWCLNGGARDGRSYRYEICSTTRSWHVQQNILTGTEYKDNGLSWSLYKKAMSVNVYYIERDNLSENNNVASYTKNSINFADRSARVFIEDAQEWFNSHKTNTGVNIRIYGVYPNIRTTSSMNKLDLQSEYMGRTDTVFWGGLFSTYSNFTTWEYHPNMMPNDVWIARQDFLNNCFVSDGNQNILELINSEESISESEAREFMSFSNIWDQFVDILDNSMDRSIIKYLPTQLEIMEEDFISMYQLKNNINMSTSYRVIDLFEWAESNPFSLQQTILLYRLKADTSNSVLFHHIRNDVENRIIYDENNIPTLAKLSDLFISTDQHGVYCLMCDDMFGETIKFPLESRYILPSDIMRESGDFDLIDLGDMLETDIESIPQSIIDLTNNAKTEISNKSAILNEKDGGINEFGPLSSIGIDPVKPLYDANSISELIQRNRNFNEMITPPRAVNVSKSKSMMDITNIGKRLVSELNLIKNPTEINGF